VLSNDSRFDAASACEVGLLHGALFDERHEQLGDCFSCALASHASPLLSTDVPSVIDPYARRRCPSKSRRCDHLLRGELGSAGVIRPRGRGCTTQPPWSRCSSRTTCADVGRGRPNASSASQPHSMVLGRDDPITPTHVALVPIGGLDRGDALQFRRIATSDRVLTPQVWLLTPFGTNAWSAQGDVVDQDRRSALRVDASLDEAPGSERRTRSLNVSLGAVGDGSRQSRSHRSRHCAARQSLRRRTRSKTRSRSV
jgi:hypothetical protein